MKTLMLDCRDPAHRPRNKHLNEEDGGSQTERTFGAADLEKTVQELNIVEDLIDKSEEEYLKNGGITGDSGSTIGDDWFKNDGQEGNGW